MKSGIKRPTYDKRDFDFHKSFGAVVPDFPKEYNVDAQLWNPNQNNTNAIIGLDIIPPLPFGCTDYTQTDLCMDEDKVQLDPMLLENETHANARGGLDIRTALKAAIKVFRRTAYFNIQAQAPLDMFDGIRLAMLSTQSERRGVSAGTPFFPEWNVDGILPTPIFDLKRASWHNWAIKGWTMIGDQPYLLCKMWTGDWKYMSRPICNALFGIRGSVAYTLSKSVPAEVNTIDFNFVQWVVSFFQSFFTHPNPPVLPPISPVELPPPPKPTIPPAPGGWATPEAARHSVRVIADEEGLTVEQKNLLCQVLSCESGFHTKTVHPNLRNGIVLSTDYGIAQWNDFYHGKEISPEEAVNNPEKAVRLMCRYIKQGQISQWVCYSSGLYKQYSA